MTLPRSSTSLSRRGALAGLGASGLGLALTGRHVVGAQEATPSDLADHPLTGVWLAMANPPRPEDPQVPVPSFFAADGSVLLVFPPIQIGQRGIEFITPGAGTWQADSDRRGHFTAVQVLSTAEGALAGSVTIDGYPEVSADGQSFIDDGSLVTITIRDPAGAVVAEVPGAGARPVTAIRMGVGRPGFPMALAAATPAASPAAANAASAGQTATINGVETYYEVQGPADGPPVLLLHGGLGNTTEFDGLIPALVEAGYRTVAMDFRRRGRSAWGDAPITYELMADDALALLDHLEIARTDLVGWSDGAIIGLELAINDPDRLNRLVAYGANFTPDGLHDPAPSPKLDAIFEELVADYQRLSPEPERFEEILGELSALSQIAPNFSEADLRSITVPVLVLDGAEEEFINADQPLRLAALIPSSELVIMPGTGHFAPIDQPEEFTRIVLGFLEG